jgi:transcriptional regulator with XRE-family HTH domain
LLRKERGLSQTALAARVGVTFQQLQKYETGKNRLSASRLYRLASVLGVDVSAFFVCLPDTVQFDPV